MTISLNDTVRARIAKLLELSRRGIGGERETAAKSLGALLERHGLTMDDVESTAEEKRAVRLEVRGRHEIRLAVHVALHYADFQTFHEISGRTTWVEIVVRPAEAARIAVAWATYRAAWREEVEKTLHALHAAFVSKHDLWPKVPIRSRHTLSGSEKEIEHVVRARALMGSLAEVDRPDSQVESVSFNHVNRRIGSGRPPQD